MSDTDTSSVGRQTIRSIVLKVLNDYPDLQFASMPRYVAEKGVQEGLLLQGARPYVDEGILTYKDKQIINEVIWELLVQGILIPGPSSGGQDFPFFHLSEYGEQCIEQEAVLPHDYDNYLSNIRSIVGEPDEIFQMYLEESVQAFLKGLYISTTVNLGVAAERLVLILVETFADQIDDHDNKEKFKSAISKAKHPAAQFDEVYRRLEVVKKDMPGSLGNDLSMLKFIQEIIRTERNDAGHPSGRRFTRDEAMTYLLTFPSYLKIYQQVYEWLRYRNL